MKGFVVSLIAVILVVANGESTATKNYIQDAKVAQQAKNGAEIQTASTHEQKLQIIQTQELQANTLTNPSILEEPTQNIQLQSAQFFEQDPASPFHNLNQGSQQVYSLNTESRQPYSAHRNDQQLHNLVSEVHDIQAYNQVQHMPSPTLEEQFRNRNRVRNQEELMHARPMMHQEQHQRRDFLQAQRLEDQQQSQQHGISGDQVDQYSVQSQAGPHEGRAQMMSPKAAFPRDLSHPGQTQFLSTRPELPRDQLVPNTFGSTDRDDVARRNNAERIFVEQSNHFRQQPGLKALAFENRMRSVQLPGMSHHHSSSLLVSGLKSLPSLPALVYSSGSVQSSPLVYSQPWRQNSAYLIQHWQTPHARYVYSHIL